MAGRILTEVSAVVDPDKDKELQAAYRAVAEGRLPGGLLTGALLHGEGGTWKIATLWRDRAALEAVRAGPEPPAALQVFRRVGAEPALAVFEVAHSIRQDAHP